MKNLKIISILLLMFAVMVSCSRTKNEYFEDGSLKSSIPYRFGKENGTCKYYFINQPHPIKIVVEMKNGKKQGDFIKYFINGKLDTRCHYDNDLLEGTEERFHIKGYRMTTTNYLHGKKHGEFIHYHPNGEMMEHGSFYEDLFDGEWEYFDERGVLVGEGKFEKGDGVQYGYNASGNLIRVVHYQNNMKNGEDIELDNEGDTLKVTVFKDDRIVINGDETISNE